MAVTLVVNTSPYGTEGPYNALRLATALQAAGEWVELFLLGDGVHTARKGQDPRGAHASLEPMLEEIIAGGAVVTLCGTCCAARGLAEADLVAGAQGGTIHDLAGLIARTDKVVSF
jgi:sulfur relay (sulfurtransferase) complex TusBCD TusD component (DsrE family)